MQPLFNVNHYLMPTISPPLFKRIGLLRQILKTCDFWVPILLTRVPISTNLTNLGHQVPMAWLHCTSIWQWIQYKLVKRYLGRKKGCTTPGFVPRTKEIFLPLMCLLVQSIIILLVYAEWDRNEHNVYVQNHSQPRVFHWTVKIFHGLFYLAGGSTKNSPWIKNRSVNFTAGQDRTWRTNILSIRNRLMFNFMATCLPHNHCTMSPPVAIDHCSWR